MFGTWLYDSSVLTSVPVKLTLHGKQIYRLKRGAYESMFLSPLRVNGMMHMLQRIMCVLGIVMFQLQTGIERSLLFIIHKPKGMIHFPSEQLSDI